jgi:hypothetical protein
LGFKAIFRFACLLLLLAIGGSAFAQNTKGDRPARPLPKVVQKSKPKKSKKIKSDTRDISGRRLRTKNSSSAARAIQRPPSTYFGRKRKGDRASKPIGNNRIQSSTARAARNNVYPNRGPYINNPSRKPRSGERSFSKAPYTDRRPTVVSRSGERPFPGRKNRVAPRSASRSFVTAGRKNVYWGKFRKGEKAYTTDIAGKPLRTRNYKSPAPVFEPGPRPYKPKKLKGKDRPYSGTFRSGFVTASKRGERAWRGDVSGRPLGRTSSGRKTENAGRFIFPRKLSISGKTRTNRPMPGSGYQSRSRHGEKKRIQGSLPPRIPRGGGGVGTYSGNLKLKNATHRLRDQGEAFSGFRKASRPLKGGGSVSGQLRNNGGNALSVRTPGARGRGAGSYSGSLKLRNARHQMRDQGEQFTGFRKASRPLQGGGSISGRLKNNNGNALAVRTPAAGARGAGSYSGNLKLRNARHQMRDQGEGFTGFRKASRPLKGGGSISGRLKNNNGSAVAVRTPAAGARGAGTYMGSIRLRNARTPIRDQGEEFTGFIRARKPVKGGGSVSGRLWNNNGQAINVRTPLARDARGANYPGRAKRDYAYLRSPKANRLALKQKEPTNNILYVNGLQVPVKRSNYLQNAKANKNSTKKKEPSDNGFAAEGLQVKVRRDYAYIRNSKSAKEALKKKEPSNTILYTKGLQVPIKRDYRYIQNPKANPGSMKKREPDDDVFAVEGLQVKIKRNYNFVQNPKANKNSLKKREPDDDVFAVEGLQVKVRQKKYGTKPEAKEGALKGIRPSAATVRASEYEGRMKQLWSFKHNPSSSKSALDVRKPNAAFAKGNNFQGRTRLTRSYRHNPKSDKDALKVLAPGRAYAKINNYQGNVKMSKPNGKNLHPDAKFAHGHRDNVKSERTFLMNVKLLWAKLFKKNDNQTEAVKEKVRRPRYDKKEKELWKDLYD